MSNIVIIGDIHGEFGALNSFINKKKPEIAINVGDFGYFPKWSWEMHHPGKKRNKFSKIATPNIGNTKLFFVEGNHEDHESLMSLKTNEIYPNVYYMKRGSILTLPDGRNVLFMGGAKSHDKEMRTIGIDWFEGEELTQNDVLSVDPNTKIDIVISHTAPVEFEIEKFIIGGAIKANDFSRKALSYILNTFNPSLWYFGHWHQELSGFTKGCRWTALNHIRSSGKFFDYLK